MTGDIMLSLSWTSARDFSSVLSSMKPIAFFPLPLPVEVVSETHSTLETLSIMFLPFYVVRIVFSRKRAC